MLVMKDFITDREFSVNAVLAFAALQESSVSGCIESLAVPEGHNFDKVLPCGGVWIVDNSSNMYSWTMDMLKKVGDTTQKEYEEEEDRIYHHAMVDNFETDHEISHSRYMNISDRYFSALRTYFKGYKKSVSFDFEDSTAAVKTFISGSTQKKETHICEESGFPSIITIYEIEQEGVEVLLPFIRRMLNYRYRINNDDYILKINGWLFKSAKMSDKTFETHVNKHCRSIFAKFIESPSDLIKALV